MVMCVCVGKGAVEFLIIMYYLKSSVCGYFYHPISKLKSSFFVCLNNKKIECFIKSKSKYVYY